MRARRLEVCELPAIAVDERVFCGRDALRLAADALDAFVPRCSDAG